MVSARHLLWCVLLASCADHPSRLDKTTSPPPAGDPWTATTTASGDDKDDSKPGFDLKGALAKIGDSIKKPGPYEAPEQSKDFDASKPHWGVLRVHGSVVEREGFSLMGGRGTELRTLIERLRELAKDDKLTGLLLRVQGVEISFPDIAELRAAMHEFRKAGKTLACHTEGAVNGMYLVLAACDRIGLAPLGDVAITGPAAMPIHLKPLLDKLGIQADFLHVGAYKGAAEPLTRDAPSKEMEETIGAILDRRYATMVDTIATDRKLEPANVKSLIDTAIFPPDDAKAARLVDDVTSFEAFRDDLTKGAGWEKLDLEPETTGQLAMMMKAMRFLGAMAPEKPIGNHVAVVYALGNIVDGDGDGVLGAREQIASHTLVAALRALAADDTVKAVVLRIDSGGGSAQASELIWRAVADLKAKKPVVVSMSDLAASGGYYIASGATKIFALDDTLTGSIGVVGGKLSPQGALAKLGVNTFPMGRGKHATMLARIAPWNDEEKRVIQNQMESVYKVFVGRVADGRHKKPEDIQPIAQGRVWTGTKAKELGLVDEIGGLDAAVAEAKKLGSVDAATDLEIYPPSPTLRDVIMGFGQVQAPFGIHAEDLLANLRLDPVVAAGIHHLIELVSSFQDCHIQAVAVLPVMR